MGIASLPASPLNSSPSSTSSSSAPLAALYSGVVRGATAGSGEGRRFLNADASGRPPSSENTAVPSRAAESSPLLLPTAGLQALSSSALPLTTHANNFPLQGLLNSTAASSTTTSSHASGAGSARGELSARSRLGRLGQHTLGGQGRHKRLSP